MPVTNQALANEVIQNAPSDLGDSVCYSSIPDMASALKITAYTFIVGDEGELFASHDDGVTRVKIGYLTDAGANVYPHIVSQLELVCPKIKSCVWEGIAVMEMNVEGERYVVSCYDKKGDGHPALAISSSLEGLLAKLDKCS
jgi:hypothetical protein